jgi:hypothetical protein
MGFNPDEPRDYHGRWGGGSGSPASAKGHADGVIHGMNPLDARIESLRQGVIATRAKEGKAKFLTDRILLERQATAFEHTISGLKQQRINSFGRSVTPAIATLMAKHAKHPMLEM